MNKETLTKIWTIVALGASYFSINVFVVTQGGHFLLPGLKLDQIEGRAAAVYGTWFVMPMIMVSLFLVIVHIKRFGGVRRAARLPVAFNVSLDFNDWIAAVYQGFFFTAFLLLPNFACGHFLRKMLYGTVTDKARDSAEVASTPLEHLTQYSDPGAILGSGNRYRFENEVTFFPFWQPWLSLLLTMLCIGMFLYVVYLIAKPVNNN